MFKDKVISILKVYREDLTKEVVALDILYGEVKKRISFERLKELKACGYTFSNAVLDSRGILRAKSGSLDTKYVITKNLSSYKNNKTYDGNTNKYGITVNNVDYIVKSAKNDYDTSVFSEYVVSKLGELLGYNTHETFLYKDGDNVVVILKDFCISGYKLKSFKDIAQSSLDTDMSTKDYTYHDVIYMINKHNKLSLAQKEALIIQFWDMFMLDAVFGNRDRHHGNWGYMSKGLDCKVAKIYDNGGSLFPNVLTKIDEYTHDKKKFLFERSEKFPASLLKEKRENGEIKRTNYYEYMELHARNQYMDLAYNKIYSVGVTKLFELSKKICYNRYIPDILSDFYVSIICMRYAHIIQRLGLEDSYHQLERLEQLWRIK